MTIVAARKYTDAQTIEFASDSLIIAHNNTKETKSGISKQSPKLFQTPEIVIGGCGNLVDITLLFMYSEKHLPDDASPQSIIKWFVEFYKIERPSFTPSDYNEYIIAYQDKLFNISDLYHVQEVDEYYSIGSGQRYSQAAMYLGFDPTIAVKTACEFDTACGGNLVFYKHLYD